MFENSVKIKPIVYRFPRMIWSVNQIELFGFFTDLGTLTSASINLVFNKELLIVHMWSAEQNISQAGKGVFHKIPAFPVMSLTKILETFIRSFPSSFNRKYVHMVACTVVFVGPACFVCNAYPGRNATCPLSSCSNKNDGHAVALTDFYRCL